MLKAIDSSPCVSLSASHSASWRSTRVVLSARAGPAPCSELSWPAARGGAGATGWIRHREPSLGLWSVKLVHDLRRAILEDGIRRVGQFAERHVAGELAWPGDPTPFMIVNTPEELSAAAARLARVRPRSRR